MSFLLRLLHEVSTSLIGFVRLLLPCTPHSSTPMDSPSEGLVIGGHSVSLREESGQARDRGLVTIDILPDEVLVEIFDFYMDINDRDWYFSQRNMWHVLVHVSRRWRYLVFASPRHLNLRLKYGGRRPMSEVLGAWPVLPVILASNGILHPKMDEWWDNCVVALESEHYKRFCEIHIEGMTNLRWKRFAAAMQKPFPQLTCLRLELTPHGDVEPVLPDSFLGGSAPHLQTLSLRRIPFPSIPKLLSSANGLVTLHLQDIPDSGYISPDAMGTALSAMTRLETLHLQFRSSRTPPDRVSQPLTSLTRFVLPALTNLSFQGIYEYLENLLSRIDAPLLYHLYITFFVDRDFNVPQLHRFIDQAEEFKTFAHAELSISGYSIRMELYPNKELVDHHRPPLRLEIIRGWFDLHWQLYPQLWSLTQICNSSFPLIPTLEKLRIRQRPGLEHGQGGMEWLRLLGPLTALKYLHLDQRIAQSVCAALQELSGERATEVLPALRNVFVSSAILQPVQKAMKPFIAARQLSGRPVAIVIDNWSW